MTTSGLEGIVVADTELSHIDGEAGELIIAGRHLAEIASSQSLVELAQVFWKDLSIDEKSFGRARMRAFGKIATLGGALVHDDGMSALGASIAQLPASSPPIDIAAAIAVFAAAWSRVRDGNEPIAPDLDETHAADYLRMIFGDVPANNVSAARAKALACYLVSVSDHGLNASTFAARVVTSTGADAVAAVGAAIGALKGPLHGGAPGPVLDMIDAARSDPQGWIAAELAAKRRIMGMGHRVYRERDPRAAVLETVCEELAAAGVASKLSDARRVEAAAQIALADKHPGRPLRANVELYTAVLLDALGIPRGLFSPTFAVGRVVGWLGHVREQAASGRLIRPLSRYVGKRPTAQSSNDVRV